MEKHKILIIWLAMLFTLWWLVITTPRSHKPTNNPTQTPHKPNTSPTIKRNSEAPVITQEIKNLSNIPVNNNLILENDNIKVIFSNKYAGIIKVILKKFKSFDKKHDLVLSATPQGSFCLSKINDEAINQIWDYKYTKKNILVFRTYIKGWYIEKVFALQKLKIKFKLTIKNTTNKPFVSQFILKGPGGITNDGDRKYYYVSGIIGIQKHKYQEDIHTYSIAKMKKGPQELSRNGLNLCAVRNRYFCSAIVFENSNKILKIGLHANKDNHILSYIKTNKEKIYPSSSLQIKGLIYFGPVHKKWIGKDPRLLALIQYGWFTGIAKLLLLCLQGFHYIIPNYGIAIILLTFLVKLLMHPLSFKSMKSIYQMQKIQPELQKLKEKYKGDKRQLNIEQMKLFRQHNINPFGSCLPIFIQLPIFIALYRALTYAIELRQSSFLWIEDLSMPDRLFTIGSFEVNILPILIVIAMIYQQKLSPKSSDPQAQMQQQMFVFFTIFLGIILYKMPSGLSLYWLSSTILSIIENYRIRKILGWNL